MGDDDIARVPAAVGPRLRLARERRGATLTDVSRATGISLSTLSRIENGRDKPNLELLLRLAEEYGATLDELAGTVSATAERPPRPSPRRRVEGKAVLPLTHSSANTNATVYAVAERSADMIRPRSPRSSEARVEYEAAVTTGR